MVEYPDKSTEIWTLSGYSDDGKVIDKFDSEGNLLSKLILDVTGEPQEYHEYIYTE